MSDALELAKKLDADYLKCIDEWDCKPEFLVVKSSILATPGLFSSNVFVEKWINNRQVILFRGVQVLQINFLTNGEYPYKFVR